MCWAVKLPTCMFRCPGWTGWRLYSARSRAMNQSVSLGTAGEAALKPKNSLFLVLTHTSSSLVKQGHCLCSAHCWLFLFLSAGVLLGHKAFRCFCQAFCWDGVGRHAPHWVGAMLQPPLAKILTTFLNVTFWYSLIFLCKEYTLNCWWYHRRNLPYYSLAAMTK